MKRTLTFLSLLLLAFCLLPGFSNPAESAAGPKVKYSKKIDGIVKNKCYGCHSAEGRSDKAKAALLWDDLPGLTAAEQAEKLQKILSVLDEGAMPPAKFLEGNPDKKLTGEETMTMKKWAEKSTKKVSK